MKSRLFSYSSLDTPIHALSGLTKLLCFLLLTFATMFSYDIRVIIGIMFFSFFVFYLSQIKYRQIKLVVWYVLAFILINAVITFLFSPEEGVEIYGSQTVILPIWGRYILTQEQLLYQSTKVLKYVSVIPLGIIFLLTTNPSEFAASLNKVGVNYKAAYAVSLTLRYFPDVQRDYREISMAQQARGLELSRKAKLGQRFKNAVLIMIPLIFSTLDRVEVISNAMDLRGFSKGRHRSWYSYKKLVKADYIALSIAVAIFIMTILVSLFVNHSRFYNPF